MVYIEIVITYAYTNFVIYLKIHNISFNINYLIFIINKYQYVSIFFLVNS